MFYEEAHALKILVRGHGYTQRVLVRNSDGKHNLCCL